MFNTIKKVIFVVALILSFAMKPIIATVRVTCQCGQWIVIRGIPGTIKVCWKCGRQVWFVLRGWRRAIGKVKDSSGEVYDTEADVRWQGQKK